MGTLAEKYRPSRLEDLAGFDEMKKTLGKLLARGAGGKVFWFSGSSGTGKTTLARIIARGVAEPTYCIDEVDAGKLTASAPDRLSWARSVTLSYRSRGERSLGTSGAETKRRL